MTIGIGAHAALLGRAGIQGAHSSIDGVDDAPSRPALPVGNPLREISIEDGDNIAVHQPGAGDDQLHRAPVNGPVQQHARDSGQSRVERIGLRYQLASRPGGQVQRGTDLGAGAGGAGDQGVTRIGIVALGVGNAV